MRRGSINKWCPKISIVVLVGGLVLGTSSMVVQAADRDDERHKGNSFDQILHKLDKILDAMKEGGGQDANHTLRWDQALPAAQRFVILPAFNNAAVLDKNTGLVWEKSPDTTKFVWEISRYICLGKNVGGQRGWRLPAIAELMSLIDPTVPHNGARLPPGHPFLNVQSSSNYWTATRSGDPNAPNDAWDVDMFNGDPSSHNIVTPFFTWCVRGPMQEGSH